MGVEYRNRRRNKFSGKITHMHSADHPTNLLKKEIHLSLFVTQSLGNCPKYINIRDLIYHPHDPLVEESSMTRQHAIGELIGNQMTEEFVQFVYSCDTVYIATRHFVCFGLL